MGTQTELCHLGFLSNSWREVGNNENEYTYAGGIAAKCFVVVLAAVGAHECGSEIGKQNFVAESIA
ncbi:hypothetical protein L195_g043159, partial [Trifolium pratense]